MAVDGAEHHDLAVRREELHVQMAMAKSQQESQLALKRMEQEILEAEMADRERGRCHEGKLRAVENEDAGKRAEKERAFQLEARTRERLVEEVLLKKKERQLDQELRIKELECLSKNLLISLLALLVLLAFNQGALLLLIIVGLCLLLAHASWF